MTKEVVTVLEEHMTKGRTEEKERVVCREEKERVVCRDCKSCWCSRG